MLASAPGVGLRTETVPKSKDFLSTAQISEFRARGVLRLNEFHEEKLCNRLVDSFWDVIGRYGVERDDQSTWTCVGNPVLEYPSLKRELKRVSLNVLYSNTLRQTAQALVGTDDLVETSAMWLITFPHLRSHRNKVWEMPRTMWHTDCPRLPGAQAPGVVVLNYLSNVKPESGGTAVVAGSHKLFCTGNARMSSRQFKKKLKHHEFFRTLYSKSSDRPAELRGAKANVEGIEVEAMELTGRIGDVVFLDGRILHSITENVGSTPRLMARTFYGSRALFESYGASVDQ